MKIPKSPCYPGSHCFKVLHPFHNRLTGETKLSATAGRLVITGKERVTRTQERDRWSKAKCLNV